MLTMKTLRQRKECSSEFYVSLQIKRAENGEGKGWDAKKSTWPLHNLTREERIEGRKKYHGRL